MKYKKPTPERLEFLRKELIHFKQQLKDNKKLLKDYETGKSKDYRDADLSRYNIRSAETEIRHILLEVRYGNYSCPVPPVSIANWDFTSWCKYLESTGVEPL